MDNKPQKTISPTIKVPVLEKLWQAIGRVTNNTVDKLPLYGEIKQ
jgi:hypothetical protein